MAEELLPEDAEFDEEEEDEEDEGGAGMGGAGMDDQLSGDESELESDSETSGGSGLSKGKGKGKGKAPAAPAPTGLFGPSMSEVAELTTSSRRRRKRQKQTLSQRVNEQEEVRLGLGQKRKRRRTGRSSGKQLPPELSALLGEAHSYFMEGKHDTAIEALKEVVRQAPNVPDSYHTLGMIYQERGEIDKAVELFKMGAHLTRKDVSLWRHVAVTAMDVDDKEQAMTALTQLRKLAPDDVEVASDLAALLEDAGSHHKALPLYETLLLHPENAQRVDYALATAVLAEKEGDADLSIRALAHVIRLCLHLRGGPPLKPPGDAGGQGGNSGPEQWRLIQEPGGLNEQEEAVTKDATTQLEETEQRELGLSTVGHLVEIYTSGTLAGEAGTGEGSSGAVNLVTYLTVMRDFAMSASLIAATEARLTQLRRRAEDRAEANGSEVDVSAYLLPLDLVVSLGICRIHQGSVEGAIPCFSLLMRLDPAQSATTSRLLERVTDAFVAAGQSQRALPVWRRYLLGPENNHPRAWLRMAMLYFETRRPAQAVHWALKILRGPTLGPSPADLASDDGGASTTASASTDVAQKATETGVLLLCAAFLALDAAKALNSSSSGSAATALGPPGAPGTEQDPDQSMEQALDAIATVLRAGTILAASSLTLTGTSTLLLLSLPWSCPISSTCPAWCGFRHRRLRTRRHGQEDRARGAWCGAGGQSLLGH